MHVCFLWMSERNAARGQHRPLLPDPARLADPRSTSAAGNCKPDDGTWQNLSSWRSRLVSGAVSLFSTYGPTCHPPIASGLILSAPPPNWHFYRIQHGMALNTHYVHKTHTIQPKLITSSLHWFILPWSEDYSTVHLRIHPVCGRSIRTTCQFGGVRESHDHNCKNQTFPTN